MVQMTHFQYCSGTGAVLRDVSQCLARQESGRQAPDAISLSGSQARPRPRATLQQLEACLLAALHCRHRPWAQVPSWTAVLKRCL